MSLHATLTTFRDSAVQCSSLIANAHQSAAAGAMLLPEIDRQQITVAAFLNLFVAWETFIEEAMAKLLSGEPTISGAVPVRFAIPPSVETARALVIGVHRYFDYGNHDYVKRLVILYFKGGYPFEPHLSVISSDLADLRTMRNSSAHLSSTTQVALEGLAQRVLGHPRPGISLYTFLTSPHPKSPSGDTVFGHALATLLVTAELIANG